MTFIQSFILNPQNRHQHKTIDNSAVDLQVELPATKATQISKSTLYMHLYQSMVISQVF